MNSNNQRKIRIKSSATHFPGTKVASDFLDRKLGFEVGTIAKRTGVKFRFHRGPNDCISSLGAAVAKKALDKAELKPEDLDLIVAAGATPEQLIPCNSVMMHEALDAPEHVNCLDIDTTCMSFLSALDFVSSSVEIGRYKRVMIVSSEFGSSALNWKNIETVGLFGDGAAAFIIEKDAPNLVIEDCSFKILSHLKDCCEVVGGGSKLPAFEYTPQNHDQYLFKMEGRELYKTVAVHLPKFITEFLGTHNLTMDDIGMVIPHQPSLSAMRMIQKKLGISQSRCIEIIQDFGNCISASIPMALHVAIQQGRLQDGKPALIIGTGAGVTLGAMLIRFTQEKV